jgi:DNA-binding CsgD family transcriptional regulator
MRAIGSLVLSPRRLFLSVAERVARSLFRVVACRVGELADGRVWAETSIPRRYRDSTSFLWASMGALQAYPRLVGGPDASVEAEITSHRGFYVIEPPDSRTIATRAARLLRSPLGWMRQERTEGIEPSQSHVLEAVELAFGGGESLARATALGERLAQAEDLLALAKAFSTFLEESFGSAHLQLWVKGEGDAWHEPILLPAPPRRLASRRTLPVMLSGREIARAEVDVPQLELAEPVPLLAAALPWLSVGICRCTNHTSAGTARERTSRAAHAWGLSPRQAEALDLLAAGCSNREVAKALGTSVKTVEAHVTSILRKAGVESRSALVARVWSGI